jgi:hypothetical protein
MSVASLALGSTNSWYEVISGRLLYQCDVLRDVIVPIVPEVDALEEIRRAYDEQGEDESTFPSLLLKTDLMVLTQTCDLIKPEQLSVLTARIERWYPELTANMGSNKRKAQQGDLQRGRLEYCCLLSEREEEPLMEWSVVDFRELHTLPREYLEDHADSQGLRLRLTPPYREHVSQSFARFIMRVALDDPLEVFREWAPPVEDEQPSLTAG